MKLFTKRNLSNGAATRNRYFYIFTVERDVVLDTVSKVSVLGIALYRRKIVADFEIISLLGIKVAKKQINRENLDKLSLSFLINKASEVHPSHSDFISLCGSPSGEIFLFLGLLDAFVKKHCGNRRPVLVVDKAWKMSICKIFAPDIPCLNINSAVLTHQSLSLSLPNNKTGFSIFPTTHYLLQDDKIRNEGAHYFNEIVADLNLSSGDFKPKFSLTEDVNITVRKKAQLAGLDLNNFVILCPEATTCSDTDFNWNKIIKAIKAKGFDVYVNCTKDSKPFKKEKNFFLTHEELLSLAEQSKLIIGIRSGLIEILTVVGKPIVSIYTPIPKRGILEAFTSKQTLSGFSLKKIPSCRNRSDIYEYTIETGENALIEKISSLL